MSATQYYTTMDTPCGPLCLAGTPDGLTHVEFQHGKRPLVPTPGWREDATVLQDAVQQLYAYFKGEREQFALALAPAGTAFQRTVWEALQRIPFGATTTYHEIAQRLGKPNGARAVGTANGRNPIAIIIPCHRVIGADGQLRGYAGGLAIKQRLLRHEGVRLL